jgi:hypothetical protein
MKFEQKQTKATKLILWSAAACRRFESGSKLPHSKLFSFSLFLLFGFSALGRGRL